MSTTTNLRILVAGGGIAGNAVALQLVRAGVAVTVVERAETPRPGGQAVDLRGPSRMVAERMGLMEGIRKYQLQEEAMLLVDRKGAEIYRMGADMFDGKGPVADIEISRGDLNNVLLTELAAAAGELDYRYGEWVEGLTQDETGVAVTFASGAVERFDLVIGADGVHSATRRMAFGPEEQFATYLGGYMSFYTIDTPAGVNPEWMTIHPVPSASVGVRADADPATSKAIITLRTEQNPALRRDVAAQQQLIRDMLAGAGWKAPEILAAMDSTPDFYFDELVRIDMPTLSAGRVTLLGDSAFCGSPMTGMGTAMAIVGAYVLAGEIASTPGDLAAALARYEEIVTPFLAKAKEIPGGGIKMMLPTSEFGLKAAQLMGKLMTTKIMRPVMMKMLDQTEDYVLPEY
ncbi:FAD-dependent monooxygenase [Nocardia huaxiensis]|uniref:FAD-dependent monooxygenase n=1 Tax=Nocardia huaxiensis TaxID=2755382 RepID=A0A7D6Z1Q7_9NOCA|nr:FAD-dependent monooxygenase [Nocardia huaxiensis]QLY28544.1 FAD-dependent monooxygenase [Nocardia huaxiensis]UFS97991.1 FAD-dependent monooxygenase [Nocardia huaxiensis]